MRCPDPSGSPDWPYRGFSDAQEANDADGFAAGVRTKFNFAIRLARQMQEIAALRPRDSSDTQAARRQSEALKNVVAGSLGHGVTYEHMMRVLIQLTDPKEVAAEIVVQAAPKKKGAVPVSGRYLYNRGLNEDPVLKRLYETAAKFNPPSTFSD